MSHKRKADLTQADLMARLDYDPETGGFSWKRGAAPSKSDGATAGWVTALGYAAIKINRSKYMAHRLAWLYANGEWPEHDIDHINGIKTDNRLANLRDVHVSVNQQNRRRAARGNSGGVLGVCWNKVARKWNASIQIKGQHIHLGRFEAKDDAGAAYLAAKRRLHEGCTT